MLGILYAVHLYLLFHVYWFFRFQFKCLFLREIYPDPHTRSSSHIISPLNTWHFSLILFITFLFLFLKYFILGSRERRQKERERNIHVRVKHEVVASPTLPTWRPGPQPRHVSWVGIEPPTFQPIGQHSVHWVTPARAIYYIFKIYIWWLFV